LPTSTKIDIKTKEPGKADVEQEQSWREVCRGGVSSDGDEHFPDAREKEDPPVSERCRCDEQ